MTLLTRPVPLDRTRAPRRPALDVLFAVAVGLLLAMHLTIFVAVLVLAPVTPAEARSLALLHLPEEVARALILPFHALLLACLFTLGRRAAGRWAGFGAMLAVLAVDLRADPTQIVYGPSVATGGWVAASLLAAAFVAVPRHRRAAALLAGAATVCAATAVLALPAFLFAIGLRRDTRTGRLRALGAFAGWWAIPAAAGQLLWFSSLGADGWIARVVQATAEFRPHPLVPFLEQQRILFAGWHFDPLLTVVLFLFLVLFAATGATRTLVVPLPGEEGSAVARVLRRFPIEFCAAFGTMACYGVWWALSGSTVLIDPNLPALAATAPLITAMAYRGAKWLLTVNRFWALAATVYLVGLISVRSLQVVITLVQSFQY